MTRKRKSTQRIDNGNNTLRRNERLDLLADEFTKERIRDELAKYPKEFHVKILESLLKKFLYEPTNTQVLEVISDLPKEKQIIILESMKAYYIALEKP